MKVHRMSFDGALLERGFWLYAWMIRHGNERFVYVGRTGDSSSKFAVSPFSRLSRHLDALPSAKANMLFRKIKSHGWEPIACTYELIAFGPIFSEQGDLAQHRSVRDIVAPLETELAAMFKSNGYDVLGSHGKPSTADPKLLEQVKTAFQNAFA
jgi:hypothetical protein